MAVIPSPGLILPVSDRVDLVQGNPPLSPPGVARIAMIAGVPSVSINGGAYASFGTGGAASTGTQLSPSILPASDRLDIIQGNPPVSAAGSGRLAIIGGVASLSVEGAAFASLGVSGAAPTACALFSDGLPPTGWIDIIQGNPPISQRGMARIACFTGATTLSISIEGAAYVTLGGIAPPGTPTLWFSARNIDGSNNGTLVDGQVVGTWTNLGSAGAGGNLVQATAGSRPFFRAVAAAGKINNMPAVQGDGTRWMSTGAITAFTQPSLVAAVLRSETIPAVEFWIDGRNSGGTARQTLLEQSGVAEMASNGIVAIGTALAAKFSSVNGLFNGASSQGRVDGVAGAVVNAGVFTLDGMSVFASNATTGLMNGYIAEILAYTGGGQPTAAQVEAYFASIYGVTPS